jgi:hypothetical protein
MQTANAQLDTSPAPCNNKPSYKGRMWMLRHPWYIRHIGDCGMKQISVFDFYVLGRALDPLYAWNQNTLCDAAAIDAVAAFDQLVEALGRDTFLLPATIDAGKALITSLQETFGESLHVGFWVGADKATLRHHAAHLHVSARNFESVFRLDAARMAVFAVPKKGIYQTSDLIEQAEQHLPASLAHLLPEQAKVDIAAAGKCLALDVSTASAFHTWRSLETVFGAYHVALTGKTFEEAKVSRNWGKYIEALTKAGVDAKITGNLDHIREHYRNPCMHPNENASEDEAFSLFGIGISAITQVLQAIAALQPKP